MRRKSWELALEVAHSDTFLDSLQEGPETLASVLFEDSEKKALARGIEAGMTDGVDSQEVFSLVPQAKKFLEATSARYKMLDDRTVLGPLPVALTQLLSNKWTPGGCEELGLDSEAQKDWLAFEECMRSLSLDHRRKIARALMNLIHQAVEELVLLDFPPTPKQPNFDD